MWLKRKQTTPVEQKTVNSNHRQNQHYYQSQNKPHQQHVTNSAISYCNNLQTDHQNTIFNFSCQATPLQFYPLNVNNTSYYPPSHSPAPNIILIPQNTTCQFHQPLSKFTSSFKIYGDSQHLAYKRLELSNFDGQDSVGCLYRAEQYIKVHHTSLTQ